MSRAGRPVASAVLYAIGSARGVDGARDRVRVVELCHVGHGLAAAWTRPLLCDGLSLRLPAFLVVAVVVPALGGGTPASVLPPPLGTPAGRAPSGGGLQYPAAGAA